MVGSQGLSIPLTSATTAKYLEDPTPGAEARYRARFYFDVNALTMTNATSHTVMVGYMTNTSTAVWEVALRRNGTAYELRVHNRNTASVWSVSPWVVISDDKHQIELDWQAGTAGSLAWWIDGAAQTAPAATNNSTRRVDIVRIGAVSGVDATTSGAFYLDGFESRRSSAIGAPATQTMVTTAITYGYDPLYRLTSATYSDGTLFGYQYDAVGNVLTKTQTISGTPAIQTYAYDDANRQTSAAGLAQTYDNNGNLTHDGTTAYTWDGANRMTASGSTAYSYNGLNDRVSAGGATHQLDLNAGLTQVLSDGTNTYLYGAGRLGEQQGAAWQYHLADGLGSVRQLADAGGAVSAAKSYEPYGEVLSSAGTASSAYGFTGEQQDASGKLVYLRARYYQVEAMRFASRDTWAGEAGRPMSFNKWGYVSGDPVNMSDPSGYCPSCFVFFFPGAGGVSNELTDRDLGAPQAEFLRTLQQRTGANVQVIYPYGRGDVDFMRDPVDTMWSALGFGIVHREDPGLWLLNLVGGTFANYRGVGELARIKSETVSQQVGDCAKSLGAAKVDFLAFSAGGQIAYSTAQALSGKLRIRNLVTIGSPMNYWAGKGNIEKLWALRSAHDTVPQFAQSLFAGIESSYSRLVVPSKRKQFNIRGCIILGEGLKHDSAFNLQDDSLIYQGLSCEAAGRSKGRPPMNTINLSEGVLNYLIRVVGLGAK